MGCDVVTYSWEKMDVVKDVLQLNTWQNKQLLRKASSEPAAKACSEPPAKILRSEP